MEKIIISEKVAQQVERLVDILFDEGYFCYKGKCRKVCRQNKKLHHYHPSTPAFGTSNKRYDAWFCRHKHNKHTTWYVTFDTNEVTWLIKNIFNNHGPDYATFLRSIQK